MKVSEFIREISTEGWSATLRPGGHYRAVHPDASEAVFFAATPSDWRWVENTRAWMRRVLPQEPKPKRPAEPRARRRTSAVPRPAPVRDFGSPLMMHQLPEPERRLYPPLEPPRRRIPGGPAGFRSCLDRV